MQASCGARQARTGGPPAPPPGPRRRRAVESLHGQQWQQQLASGGPPPGVASLQSEPLRQASLAAGRLSPCGSRRAAPQAAEAVVGGEAAQAVPEPGTVDAEAANEAAPITTPQPSLQPSSAGEPPQASPQFSLDSRATGLLCILGVAMLKGSYNPMLRLLYAQDGPPGPVAIMLFRGVLQSFVLVSAYLLVAHFTKVEGGEAGPDGTLATAEGVAVGISPPAALPSNAHNGTTSSSDDAVLEPNLVPAWAQRISSRLPYTAIAATELGLWLFLATAIQTLGLQLTTATRAGFLIQSTALLTPLLASFTGEKPRRNVWIGCIVALVGCLCIAADESATDADDAALFSLGERSPLFGQAARWAAFAAAVPSIRALAGGDAAVLSAAFFFSLAMVRLGTYARRIPSVELAAAKSVVLGGVALITFVFAAASMAAAGDPITDLWPGYDNPLSWAVMVYCALGPGALAAFLHAKGQSTVPPAEAQVGPPVASLRQRVRQAPRAWRAHQLRLPSVQVMFSTLPLWSIAFAFLLLGGEPMSEKTLVGGAAVVAAGFIASRKEPVDKASKQE